MFKRLLVPLDGSRFGLRALSYATEVARRFEAEIILLQVIKPTTPVISQGPQGEASPVGSEIALKSAAEEDARNAVRAKRYLSSKVRGIISQGMAGSYSVVVGDPSQSIISFSHKERIDLIVMSTHGKSGLKRAIMGSVADSVIRESGKPVLVIRPPSRSKKRSR